MSTDPKDVRSYQDLVVWQKAMDTAVAVYDLTKAAEAPVFSTAYLPIAYCLLALFPFIPTSAISPAPMRAVVAELVDAQR